ncbi:MAG: hypothetical protein L0Y58_01345 [Verrucomicrobia subdivision 3 bacterium]|nr:hypothetical protein [Limisphaerales bacterium]
MNTNREALKLALALFVCVFAASSSLRGEDAFYRVTLSSISILEGKLPTERAGVFPHFRTFTAYQPYCALEGEGEAYLSGDPINHWHRTADLFESQLAVRAPRGKEVIGFIFVPRPDGSGSSVKFKIRPEQANPQGQQDFFTIKRDYYANLRTRDLPGAAWFRHQEHAAMEALGINPVEGMRFAGRRRGPFGADDTFELFSAGRAISENLQLDRDLPLNRTNATLVPVANLDGISVREMDWKPLIKDAKPRLDPLAACLPHDQHAIFFPSFTAMLDVLDEADAGGTPLLQWLEPRSQDALVRTRYQKQLCLELDELSRALGPQVISSVAITGSDPYLRTGSDIGILFEAKSAPLLKATYVARHAAAKQRFPDAKTRDGEVEGVSYTGVVTDDRAISSYVAALNDVVFVSNSLYQLGELIKVAKAKKPALASQDEYIFFRHRYARTDPNESAFLILTDATIRRWCAPRWRIANSRRTRAAAAMAEAQAAHLDSLVRTAVKPMKVGDTGASVARDELRITTNGVASAAYGNLDFLTPIAELPLDQVTRSEADAYEAWRNGYQQNWRQFFDPIAIRVSLNGRKLTAEVTVTPLIANTDYARFISVTRGASIAPQAGDPHADTLLHFAMAINSQSDLLKQAGNWLGSMNSSLRANPFGWLGESISIYADKDPFWDNLAKAADADKFFRQHHHEFPIAVQCETRSALGLATFLGAVRAFVDQTAPGMTVWQTLDHRGKAYVKVAGSESVRRGQQEWANTAIYYAATPDALVVTLSEPLLKRALDRQLTGAEEKTSSAWLGTNLCLKVDQKILSAINSANPGFVAQQQLLSWNNLPILNEWKRRYPGQDPVALHERFWQTRLVCPSGGAYVWNAKWQTMESTVYGHPGEPKKGPDGLGPLARFQSANFGLTFEHQGVSAKVVLEREVKQTAIEPKKVASLGQRLKKWLKG